MRVEQLLLVALIGVGAALVLWRLRRTPPAPLRADGMSPVSSADRPTLSEPPTREELTELYAHELAFTAGASPRR
jgi:hypothetical protein